MKNTLVALISLVVLSGCAQYGKLITSSLPNKCNGTGHSVTWIKYGDSHVGALAYTQIGRRAEWRFLLQPDRPGVGVYDDALVTITAKPTGASQPWLSISGRYSDGTGLVLCVPDSLVVGTTIDYMIEVENVGKLDPRAEVVPN